MPLEPIFDDKTGKTRVTGPAAFAIDGKDETAWGIDAGPGLRNQSAEGSVHPGGRPFPIPQGTILTITLAQNHGGWNSGDNQSNNLGKFRLSITNTPDATADPVPNGRARNPFYSRRRAHSPAGADRVRLLAHHGPGVESGKRRDCGNLARLSRRDCATGFGTRADAAGNAHPDARAIS